MILKQIQTGLQQLYHLEIDQNVENFLISTSKKTVGSRTAREALFIKQSPNQIELGLFVAKEILNTLEQHNPFVAIQPKNLKPFLIAIEGVSHFLYLLQKAQQGRSVTQLELELQAEVDQYLLVCLLYFRQTRKIPDGCFVQLFEQLEWHPALSNAEKIRYQEANRFAAKFCAYLDREYLRYHRWNQALEQARQFYHLNHWAKIARLTP